MKSLTKREMRNIREGKFMMTMGNGATEDWKIPCLDALYEETLEYGKFI